MRSVFLTPHEDKVDVLTPVNILFRAGGDFSCDDDHEVMMKMKMKMMMMMMMITIIIIIIMTIGKCGATSGLGRTCLNAI